MECIVAAPSDGKENKNRVNIILKKDHHRESILYNEEFNMSQDVHRCALLSLFDKRLHLCYM